MTDLFTQPELLFRSFPDRPFQLPPELGRLREERPLAPMRFPDGHEGWLATGYDEARAVLGHQAFSNRYELMHVPLPGFSGELPPAQPGDFLGLDAPEHTRFRKLLAGKFTPRRMRLLAEQVAACTEDRLTVLAGSARPADLMEVYARPIPALVICELLGVPSADREWFRRMVDGMLAREGVTADDIAANWTALSDYLRELVRGKRARPTDDVLSELTTSDLTEDELAGVGAFLLGAGLHTTATVLGLSTFALLINPGQLAALRADPGLTDRAIEELLRYTGIGGGSARAAVADVEIGGQLVRAGQTVAISPIAANRDPRRFPDGDALDITRDASGHLSFAHGVHQCLGQHLARIELRTALPALLNRFPTLELAIPVHEVPLRTDANMYDLAGLPVTWKD
ncbi:cytochrome P450 [Amycolatopsis sp. 195334CR]|uniref:cytochrome P450 n=1 Tax=Amycolatopsis sp. 195334CR TaxID=2814588 RepID=UPI001A8DF126|nr:cytochrome P450 [Amycolatopsis sp. 195334CR]MBN6042082.1 cytochrome P450 [Amycolatopsis sp. 195334CR]